MNPTWHTAEVGAILKNLNTTEHGLSSEEAKRRLEKYGQNKLPEPKVDHLVTIFLRQFMSPIIYILLVATVTVYLLGDTADAGIILAVLIFNAIIGAIQEGKAQNTLLALKQFIETKAIVIRDGKELIIPDHEVIPGDILVLQEGEKIPADARIISANNLKIDEASLTGESEAVHKTPDVITNTEILPAEQKNMVFKGTHIVSGVGRAVVVSSGIETLIGSIAKQIATIDTEIPLKANVRGLSRIIVSVIAVVSVALFILGVTRGTSVGEMFIVVVSIAVSAIPEGLPVALTLILAGGVWRMSKRNALVKRLQAVEALGQARVIAVDKTGTLTKNEMVIQKVFANNNMFNIEGIGYEPKGEVTLNGQNVNIPSYPELILAGKIATYCANNRTIFVEETESWRVTGDPTETAMYVLGQKLGFDKDDLERENPLELEITFDYRLKYHATKHTESTGPFITVVGAPEVLLTLADRIWLDGKEEKITKEKMLELEGVITSLSNEGLRVLALAYSTKSPKEFTPDGISELTLVGFFGMKDALREEVVEATKRAQEAGIRVVMITGDHQNTATAIAREAQIYKDGDMVLTGREIDAMSEDELKDILPRVSVFARVTPDHKLHIINAYKARGEIIAMTGDGVNDAPSLVAADLGVSMGKIGTEVAKEASDIVLLDDNFGNIVSAVEEGRSIYKTIRKVVLYLLSTSFGELIAISVTIILGLPLPLLPVQIIWLNFVTDGFFTLALALEPKEKGLLQGNFEKPKKYLVDRALVTRMIIMSSVMVVGTLLLFISIYEEDLTKAWTISLTLLAAYQWFNAWNCRSDKESIFNIHSLTNRYMFGATVGAVGFQLLAVYHPLFQRFLRTTALDLSEWLIIISFASSIILVEEIRKFFVRHRKDSKVISSVIQTAN